MADLKISALTAITPPIQHGDVLPVVQSSSTKKANTAIIAPDQIWLSDRTSAVSTPSAGLSVYATAKANRRRPGWVGPSGVDVSMQSHLSANKIGFWSALGNSNGAFAGTPGGVYVYNLNNIVAGATSRTAAITTVLTSQRRMGFTATTTVEASYSHGVQQFSRRTGFEYILRFNNAANSLAAGRLMHFGLVATTTPLNAFTQTFDGCALKVEPGGGVARIYFSTCNGAGWNAVTLPQGGQYLDATAFPGQDVSNVVPYELRMFCAPAGDTIYFRLENLNTGASQEAAATTFLPGIDVLLNPMCVTALTSASGTLASFDMTSLYIETDY